MLGYTCIKEAYFLILKIQIYGREIFAILRVFCAFPIRHKWKKMEKTYFFFLNSTIFL